MIGTLAEVSAERTVVFDFPDFDSVAADYDGPSGNNALIQRLRAQTMAAVVSYAPPGSRLVETDIATRFSVSRTPVRGALQRLQQEGYILDSPSMRQSRPTVAPLTKEDAAELFDIVAELEGLAAHSAAQLPPGKRQALAKDLTGINNEFRRAASVSRPDHNRLWDLDEKFHKRYVEVGAGLRLKALHTSVKPQAERGK